MPGNAVSGDNSNIISYEDFVKAHGVLLAASGLPQSLHRRLFYKLTSETFDGGAHFSIEPCEDGRQRRLLLTSDFMAEESDVFLIDHAWTFRLPDAYKQLREVPGLAERMAALMCVDVDTEEDSEGVEENGEKLSVEDVLESEIRRAVENGDGVRWLELEDLAINDDKLLSLGLSSKFPDLEALSLRGNKLENPDVVVQEVIKFKNIKGLWVNNNPVIKKGGSRMEKAILGGCQDLEIYNSHFTTSFGFWALGFCADIFGKDTPLGPSSGDLPLSAVTSLDLSNRAINNLINKSFSAFEMPSLSSLNIRGNPLDEMTKEELFAMLSPFQYLQSLEVDIPGPLGDNATEILKTLPRLSVLNGVDASKILETEKHVVDSMLQPRLPEWTPGEPLVDRILNAMWLYLMTYRLADEEKIDETSVWYVMDELGSALRHSDEPNFRVAPFLFMPEKRLASAVSFSILWPTHGIQKGDECTRDFLIGIGEDKQRSARLTAWFHTPETYFVKEYEKHRLYLQSRKLPGLPAKPSSASSLCLTDGTTLRVYTDIPQVQEFLTRPEFLITSEPEDADIIWTGMQVDEETKKAAGISDRQYVNQFPFEACIVMKHHLAETIQKAQGSPDWLQPTYNLETSLSQLIGDYCIRKQHGLNNLWILKPWNMARTIDTTVTGDLCATIRLMETGPKICQKYIELPALFKGRKFDLRYIVLVRSMNPLEVFLADVFWVRLANNQYSLEKHSLHEYETHFTVMNYRGGVNHMHISEFVREFEQEHGVKWMDIHRRVKSMIRAVFESAAAVHPEMHNPKSRAMYGLDVMLDGSYQPKLLEVTYCPDCMRACKYDTEAILGQEELIRGCDFFNFVFGCLFLNETKHVTQL